MSEDGELREHCGVFGCVAAGPWPTALDVGQMIYIGLVAIQHRGQEGAGIVIGKGGGPNEKLAIHKASGLVNNAFTDEVMRGLRGNIGIGHTRYSTLGGSEITGVQPFVVHTAHGLITVAHNGELVNSWKLRQQILKNGVGLSTGSDSELITQMLSLPPPCGEPNGPDWLARIKHLMSITKISYSLVIMHNDTIYGVRDPFGNRPLCIGKLVPPTSIAAPDVVSNDEIEGWVISSESCAFTAISARLFREVDPGEIVEITRDGVRSLDIVPRPNNAPPAACIFEYVYFARADSIFEGQMVYGARKECGRQLARESYVEADLVSTIPESATPAALGFSEQSGIPYAEVLCKNRYVGRTFIQPSVRLRQIGVAKKFGPLAGNFAGKRIILIDDSIVRGTTIGSIVKLLKVAGASEVHVRVASPPLHYPCYMGINIPTREELIANKLKAMELAESIGANSVVYLSVEGLVTAVQKGIVMEPKQPIGHCTACLTGDYPIDLEW